MVRSGALLLALTTSISCLSGCAVGRDDLTGEIVLGFSAGRLVENTNQALAAATHDAGALLPPPWGTLLTGAGLIFAAHAKGKDTGWDEKAKDHVSPPPPVASPQIVYLPAPLPPSVVTPLPVGAAT